MAPAPTWRVLTEIPYGNACDVEVTRVGETHVVRFAADPRGGPEAMWFCFRLSRKGPKARSNIRLVLKHVDNILGGGSPEKIHPVIRTSSADEWKRLGAGTVVELPDGRKEGTWEFDAGSEDVDVALCYPYGRPELDRLITETSGFWSLENIGVSQSGRPLLRVTNSREPNSGDAGVFLIARQHSGETPGSWVLDGLLREVALRDDPLFIWAVPLANIDGIEEGHYGKDNFPYDLNRAWGDPAMRHETLVYKRDLGRYIKRVKPVIGVDLHAPGCCETEGMYAFLPPPDKWPDCHQKSSEAACVIAGHLEGFAAEPFGRVASYKSRWDTPGFSAHCCSLGFCGLGLETPYSRVGERILTRHDYLDMGSRLARGLSEVAKDTIA